jgi:uroporphyrinogen-III synthase
MACQSKLSKMSTKTIVITRPSGQAQQLLELLNASLLNSEVSRQDFPKIISLPLLTIVPKNDDQLTEHITVALSDADLAIFVSPNAIECVMRLLKRSWDELAKKPIPIGVMGGSSEQALRNHGIGLAGSSTSIIIPQHHEQWDSEGLWLELQKRNWDWVGRKVVIFKGEGGREWLADTLKKAGASIEPISVYSRVPLDLDSPVWEAIQEMDFSQSLWLLTSSEAVRYLGKVMKDQFLQTLHTASAICSHHQIADAAEQIGFGEVFTSEPGDTALIEAAKIWLDSSVG